MATLEESVRLLVEGLAETNRKFAEANERAEAANERLEAANERSEAANGRFEAANERFAAEMLEFKEENRIGFEELRKSHKKTEEFFNTQWGKLVEALVNNQIVPLLQERGIPVQQTNQRVKGMRDGQNFEFDIIAENGDTIVVIEVKTTLRVDDVRDFLDDMAKFKKLLPRYSDMKVYGAVAFLQETSKASLFATRAGLFSILATGSSATITNPLDFKPQEF